MAPEIDLVSQTLKSIPSDTPVCLALSGGLDSRVLTKLVHSLNHFKSLRAIHINHNISPNAPQWQESCQSFCEELAVPLTVVSIDVLATLNDKASGMEAKARELRYQAFSEALNPDELLLLGHHQDDQIETLLLRLMRGSGLSGLKGMPEVRAIGNAQLLRPLLNCRREVLEEYAQESSMQWVDDESNLSERFDRNYCRHEILPRLEARWPGYREAWLKTQSLVSEADEIVNEVALQDLAQLLEDKPSVIDASGLMGLSEPRQRNVLRTWLAAMGIENSGWNSLNSITHKLMKTVGSKGQVFSSHSLELYLYKGRIHALKLLPEPLAPTGLWQPSQMSSLKLPDNGVLVLSKDCIDDENPLGSFTVRYRRGGEALKLLGRPTKTLKQLFQEAEIKPWVRDRVPLLFVDDELVYVPGFGMAENFANIHGLSQLEPIFEWHQPDLEHPELANSD